MKQVLKKIFLNNTQIKIVSLILGYSFWYIFSQSHITKIWIDVPICFYQKPENIKIDAPEKIRIQLSGKRSDMYTIDMKTIAFHINMQDTTLGIQALKLSQEQLFLPDSIKLARYSPSNIMMYVTKKNQTT